MRRYLQLSRAHTVPLESIPAILGAAIAVGGLIDLSVVIWGVAGILYHIAGYSQNSYADWKKGYDKDDENKKHHPLNTGVISPWEAKLFSYSMFVAFIVYVVAILYPSPVGLSVAAIGMVGGVSYNFIGKDTVLKFMMISVAHTSVFVMAYVDSGGVIQSPVFILSTVFVMLWIVYQISVSGEVKDLNQCEESNFLRDAPWSDVDSHITDGGMSVQFGSSVKMYSTSLRVAIAVIAAVTAEISGGGYMTILITLVLGLSAAISGVNLTTDGMYDRRVRLRNMASIEILTMYTMIVMLSPIVGVLPSLTLMVVSIIWVIAFNKYQWGTVLAPQV